MHNELTNLLPIERQRALSRDYLLRLSAVVAIFLSVLTLISAALLIPTYTFLLKTASVKGMRLANIESTLVSTNEKELSARLAALTKSASILEELKNAPSASKTVSAALVVPRPGVTLTGFVYTPSMKKAQKTLNVSGIATTRDALRGYQLALQEAPFALTVALPVSAYAKEADISFTISIGLAP